MMNIVVLALGSNLGSREENIKESLTRISTEIGKIKEISKVYETEPFGFEAEQSFLNLCISIETILSPEQVLNCSKQIEIQMGRTSHNDNQYHSRPIDIDIIFFNDQIVDIPGLKVPHPQYKSRKFVLAPLNDLVPDFIDPQTLLTVNEIFVNCDDKGLISNFNLSLYPEQ